MSPFGLCCFVIMKNANDSCSVSAAACATLARRACASTLSCLDSSAAPELEPKKIDLIFPPSKFDASMFDRIKAVEHRFTK